MFQYQPHRQYPGAFAAMIRFAQWTAVLALLVSARAADPATPAPPAPAVPSASSAINVRTDGPDGPWRVEGRRQRLELDPANLG